LILCLATLFIIPSICKFSYPKTFNTTLLELPPLENQFKNTEIPLIEKIDQFSIPSEYHEKTIPGKVHESNTSVRDLQVRTFTKAQLYNIHLLSVSEEKDITGVGVATLIISTFGIILSMYTKTTPVIVGFAYGQMQTAQLLTLVDAYLPDEYHQFSQAMSYSKLDFEFMDTTNIRMNLREKGYINGVPFTGHTYVVPTRLPAGSFFVNYVYLWMLVGILLLFHIGLIITTNIPAFRKSSHGVCDFIRAIRRSFEFSVYFYLILFTLPFTFVLTLNEIPEKYFETGLLTLSFFVSLIFLIFLIIVGLLPILFIFSQKIGLSDEEEEEDSWWQTLLKKLRAPLWNGIRENKIARLFYTVVFAKFFIFALFLILSDKKEVQLSFIIITSILYLAYLAVVRPFNYSIQNVMAIGNQSVTTLASFMFIGFMKDDATGESGLAKAIGSILGISIVITATVGFVFQGYLLHLKVVNSGMSNASAYTKGTEQGKRKSSISKQESSENMAKEANIYIQNNRSESNEA